MTFLKKRDMAKAKTEKKKSECKNGMKSFATMIEYCEGANQCRHGVFSKFFGDKAPVCGKQCDVCFEPKAAEKRVQRYQQVQIERSGGGIGSLVLKNGDCEFDIDLYEGGRRGTKRALAEYLNDEHQDGYDSDNDNNGYGEAEKKARLEREAAIRDEFAKRKGNLTRKEMAAKEREKEQNEKEAATMSKVRAAEFTSKKIPGLEINQRESYLSLLEDQMRKNLDAFNGLDTGGVSKNMSAHDLRLAAIDEEYKVFTNTKVITMYRRNMATTMANLKKSTQKLLLDPVLKKAMGLENGQESTKEESIKQKSPKESSRKAFKPPLKNSSGSNDKAKKVLKKLGLSDEDSDDDIKDAATSNGLHFASSRTLLDNKGPSSVSESSSSPELNQAADEGQITPGKDEEIIEEPESEQIQEEEEEDEQEQKKKLAKLHETIQQVKQQMSEGNDHMNYEIKMRKQSETTKSPTKQDKSPVKSSKRSKTPSPHKKVKVRVKMESSGDSQQSNKKADGDSPDKKAKKEIADAMIKLLVPHFKNGQIADKATFKIVARHMTHKLISEKHIARGMYKEFLKRFFTRNGTIKSESDARKKISAFRFDL